MGSIYLVSSVVGVLILASCAGGKSTSQDSKSSSPSGGSSNSGSMVWDFSDSSKYTFDSQAISVSAGKALIRSVDMAHDSISDFALGSHTDTGFSSAALSITTPSTFTGTYTSPILASGLSINWQSLSLTTPIPYGKELPIVSETKADYPGLPAISGSFPGLAENLVGLWHLNETSGAAVSDSTANANDGGYENSPILGQEGIFGYAPTFDRTLAHRVVVSDNASLDLSANISLQAWIKPTASNTNWATIASKSTTGSNYSYVLNYDQFSANIRFGIGDNAGSSNMITAPAPSVDEWHHVVGVADGSNVKLYVDGKLVAQMARTIGTIGDGNGPFCIGGFHESNNCASNAYDGQIDEVAIWSRALSDEEVLLLYQRGANRIKLQVRSCDDSVCSGETWQGPDGAAASYYSEIHNNSSIDINGFPSGTVNNSALTLNFSDFAASSGDVASNPYFQYKLIFEAENRDACDDGMAGLKPCLPRLSAVGLAPSNVYYGGQHSLVNKTGVSFSSLTSISFDTAGTCVPRFSISNNGTSFYYWTGTAWALSSNGFSHASTAADISANITKFTSEIGRGNFYFRAYLDSDTTEPCELNKVSLGYK